MKQMFTKDVVVLFALLYTRNAHGCYLLHMLLIPTTQNFTRHMKICSWCLQVTKSNQEMKPAIADSLS